MFPNSEIKSIANAGHWVHAEAPTQVIELIEIFAG
jgi:esterase